MARHRAAARRQRLLQIVHLSQQRARAFGEQLAFLGDEQPAGRPVHEPQRQPRFELLQSLADRGRGHVQGTRGRSEGRGSGDRHEEAQVVQ